MNIAYSVMLVVFLAFLGVLLVRYVNATVDREFRGLARAASDGEFRADELARVDRLLAGRVPFPADVRALPGPLSGGRGAAPPVLMALGVILLWGAGSAEEERALWFTGAMACLALAGVLMLATLRRRGWERTARLLRFRADLKRMDHDRRGAADDLRELVRLTPWDDAAWAELADDLTAEGRLDEALDAVGQAARLDPRYDEYRMTEAGLALRLGRLDQAGTAIGLWETMDRVKPDDPSPKLYRAALELAKGDGRQAEETLRQALRNDPEGLGLDCLDADPALEAIRQLVANRDPHRR